MIIRVSALVYQWTFVCYIGDGYFCQDRLVSLVKVSMYVSACSLLEGESSFVSD